MPFDVGDAVDLSAALQSRAVRWIMLVVAVALIGVEARILVTREWPNIGSAPKGAGCRYWTGTKVVWRRDLDGTNCPLSIQGP